MAEGHEPQPLGVYGPIVPDPNYPNVSYVTYGKLVVVSASMSVSGGGEYIGIDNFPKAPQYMVVPIWNDIGYADVSTLGRFGIRSNTSGTHTVYATIAYLMAD